MNPIQLSARHRSALRMSNFRSSVAAAVLFALGVGPTTAVPGGSGTTVAVTLAGCTAGRSVVIIASGTSTSISSAECSGETVDIHGTAINNGQIGIYHQILSIKNIQASGDKVITVTFGGTASFRTLTAIEFVGGNTAGWFEGVTTATGDASLPTVSHITTNGNDLLIGSVVYDDATPTAGDGFTIVGPIATYMSSEYKLDAGAAGAKTVNFGNANGHWSLIAASFKHA